MCAEFLHETPGCETSEATAETKKMENVKGEKVLLCLENRIETLLHFREFLLCLKALAAKCRIEFGISERYHHEQFAVVFFREALPPGGEYIVDFAFNLARLLLP